MAHIAMRSFGPIHAHLALVGLLRHCKTVGGAAEHFRHQESLQQAGGMCMGGPLSMGWAVRRIGSDTTLLERSNVHSRLMQVIGVRVNRGTSLVSGRGTEVNRPVSSQPQTNTHVNARACWCRLHVSSHPEMSTSKPLT